MVDIATLGVEVKSRGISETDSQLQKLTSTGKSAETQTNALSSSFAGVTKYITAAAAAMAAWKLSQYIQEATMLAARVETLGVVMKVVGNNAGYTGAQMDAFTAGLKKMGITTQESMNSLIKMAGANMDLEKSSKLARVAQDAAVIGGINSSEAFGRMIQGIRSGEVEILKTIGINVQFEQGYKKTAAALGVTTNELTNTQKTASRMNEVLSFGVNIAGAYEASLTTAGKQMLSMSRYTEELKLKIGQMFTEPLNSGVSALVQTLKFIDTHFKEIKISAMAATSALAGYAIISAAPAFAGLASVLGTVVLGLNSVAYAMVTAGAVSAGFGATQTVVSTGLMGETIVLAAATAGTGLFATATGLATAALTTLKLSMAAHPIGWIIAALTTAVGLWYTYKAAQDKGMDYVAPETTVLKALREEVALLEKRNNLIRGNNDMKGVSVQQADEIVALQNKIKMLDAKTKLDPTSGMFYKLEADKARADLAEMEKLYKLKVQAQADNVKLTAELANVDKIPKLEKGLSEQQQEYQSEIKSFLKDSWDNAAIQLAAEDFSKDVYKKMGMFSAKSAGFTANTSLSLGVDLQIKSLEQVEQSEKDRLELLRLQSKELERQQAVIKYIADLNAANSATAASMVGMNSVGGFDSIEDQTANQMAVLADAHKSRLDMIEIERTEKIASLKGINDAEKRAAEINSALDKKSTLEKQKNALAAASITDISHKRQLDAVAIYAGGAATLLTSLASTQDQTSRSGFETAKMFNLAAAVMSTAAGIMNQYSSGDPYTANFRAAIVAATGAIQISQIQSTTFGGGSGSVSAPSGSFAAGGTSTGSGIGNLPQQVSSVQDSRTNESIDRLIVATDNSATVIGKLSKSIDSMTALFQQGGAGYSLANNAPGKFTGTSEIATTMGTLMDIGKGYFNATVGLFTLDFKKMIGGVSDLVGGVKSAVFGGGWQTTGAGIRLGVESGNVTGGTYVNQFKDGGKFHGDDYSYQYTQNDELEDYASGLIAPFISDLTNMARTLGTSLDTSGFSMKATDIATAGRTTEQIAEDVQKWMLETLQGMSLTINGMEGATGSYDDVYETLKLLNDALVSTNDAFALVGKTTLQGTIDNAKWAVSLQNIFGGMDEFTTAMEDYFSVMYTDAEQSKMKAAAASIDVKNAFAEMYQTVQVGSRRTWFGHRDIFASVNIEVPKTIEAFNDLRNSLNVTTEEGAQLFHALTDIAPAFAEMIKYAEEFAKAQLDLNQSSISRIMKAQGWDEQAALYDQQISQAAELQAAKESLLDTTQLEIAQTLERENLLNAQAEANAKILADATSTAISAATTALRNSIDAELKMLQERAAITAKAYSDAEKVLNDSYAAQRDIIVEGQTAIMDTLKNSLDEANKAASDLQQTFDMLKSAREGMKLSSADSATMAAAQADLASILTSARNGDTSRIAGMGDTAKIVSSISAESYTNSADYQRAFWQTSNSLLELETITGKQLTDAQQQVESLNKLITTTTTANAATLKAFDAELNAIKGISANILPISEARMQYEVTKAADAAAQLELTTQTTWLNKQYDMLTNVNNSVISVQSALNSLAGLVNKPAPAAIAPAAIPVASASNNQGLTIGAMDSAEVAAAKVLYQAATGGVNTSLYNQYVGAVGGIDGVTGWNGDPAALRKYYSFAVGTNYVPYDMTANIHEGERIIPKADNYRLSQDNKEMIAELKALRAELKIQNGESAKWNQKTAKILDKWDGDGMPAVAA